MEGEGWRLEGIMRALLLRKGKEEEGDREGGEGIERMGGEGFCRTSVKLVAVHTC